MSDLKTRALALYTPPFRYEGGYIYDAKGEMVADDKADPVRVRGWGRISYLPDAAALQDQVGQLMADALTAHWKTQAAATNVVEVAEPDFYVSVQHGTPKISYDDESDSAYKWYGVWANPILYQDAQVTRKLEELDVLISLARMQLDKLQGTPVLEPLDAREREQAMQQALLHADMLRQAVARGYPTVSAAIAAAPEGDFGQLNLPLPPEHTLAPGRQYTPAKCPHEWQGWPISQAPNVEWCYLCDSKRPLST